MIQYLPISHNLPWSGPSNQYETVLYVHTAPLFTSTHKRKKMIWQFDLNLLKHLQTFTIKIILPILQHFTFSVPRAFLLLTLSLSAPSVSVLLRESVSMMSILRCAAPTLQTFTLGVAGSLALQFTSKLDTWYKTLLTGFVLWLSLISAGLLSILFSTLFFFKWNWQL